MAKDQFSSDDYQEFIHSEAEAPPLALSKEILSKVRSELTPSTRDVFSKLVAIVAMSGIVSVLLCPQFGLSFMRHSRLHHLFMHYLGVYGCNVACGAFFSIVGVGASALLLRPEELRVLRAEKGLISAALSAFFLAGFICFGSSVFFEGALLWFIGAYFGALVTTELAVSLILSRA